jgi:hypothetical protein
VARLDVILQALDAGRDGAGMAVLVGPRVARRIHP